MGILDIVQEIAGSDSPGLQMIPVASSNVAAIGFDGKETIYVAYNNGSTYAYYNQSQEMFDAFLSAPSKGKFRHAFLNGNFDRVG